MLSQLSLIIETAALVMQNPEENNQEKHKQNKKSGHCCRAMHPQGSQAPWLKTQHKPAVLQIAMCQTNKHSKMLDAACVSDLGVQ